jgi:hypothetical protein
LGLQEWIKAETSEKIAVHPTHWRPWGGLRRQGLLRKADTPVRWQSLDRAAMVSPLNEIAAEMVKRMTGSQSRLLDVGARVCWRDDKNDLGTVGYPVVQLFLWYQNSRLRRYVTTPRGHQPARCAEGGLLIAERGDP